MGRVLLLQRHKALVLMADYGKPLSPPETVGKCDIYFNLHKRVWSCRSRKTGLVEAHSKVVLCPDPCTMVVRESGRQRVLKERRKNVHAFARVEDAYIYGNAKDWAAFGRDSVGLIQVSYNPYRGGAFYRTDTGEDVTTLSSLLMVALPDRPPMVWGTIPL